LKSPQRPKQAAFNRPHPSTPDFAPFLLTAWNERMPDVDASAVPLCTMTVVLGRQMELFLESLVKPKGYQLSEYRLLVSLLTHGLDGLTPAQLNEVLMLTSAGITKSIARIEERGLVQRQPNPGDSRSVLIRLTARGDAEIRALCAHVASEQRKKLAWLSPEERDAALTGIRVLLQAVG
jgi:DNA-binding MarR family transcriptional regulator